MADEEVCTVTIWPTEVIDSTGEPSTLWHWKRLTEDGAQLDGSGPQRNGLPSKKAARELVKERYPDDEIT